MMGTNIEDTRVEIVELLRLGVGGVVNRAGDVNIDAAEEVYHLFEAGEVDDDVMVNLYAEQVLDGLLGKGRAAAGIALDFTVFEGRIDPLFELAPGLCRDLDVEVARHGKPARRL